MQKEYFSKGKIGVRYSAALALLLVIGHAQAYAAENKSNLVGQPRYIDNNNGTVSDRLTDLQWKRCSEEQTFRNNRCEGEAKLYTWTEAQALAKNANAGGKHDWRLPTIEELNILVSCSNGKQRQFKEPFFVEIKHEGHLTCKSNSRPVAVPPSIDTIAFPDTPQNFFWSSTQAEKLPYAFTVDFQLGKESFGKMSFAGAHVRLVRYQ